MTHIVWELPITPLDCLMPLADEPVKDMKRGEAVLSLIGLADYGTPTSSDNYPSLPQKIGSG